MSLPGRLGVFLSSRWLARAAAVLAVLAGLVWLYARAQIVSPEQLAEYTQNLRDLRELDARISAELLASRLQRVHNYDALTEYVRRERLIVQGAVRVPGFIEGDDRRRVLAAATRLQDTLARKDEMVDRFKRHNAVLRNSLAYFPVAVSALLDDGALAVDPGLRRRVERYSRAVLDSSLRSAESPVAGPARGAGQGAMVDAIVSHGTHIVAETAATDGLLSEIAALGSEEQLEALNRAYSVGYTRALSGRDAYRRALFAVSVGLTVFLAWLFVRLELTRRSLERAHREVSARYEAQAIAERQLMLHATAFRNAHDGITLTDADGNILDVNPAFTRITGWDREEAIGRNPRILRSGRHDREFYAAMWKAVRETGSWSGEIWNRSKYGEVYPELLSISAVRDEGGVLTNYVAVFTDIGRLKAQERQLTQLAYYDALTELPNRTLLADRIVQGIAQTRRTDTLMAVCYLDLDGFKAINDTWGHDAGDNVLVDVAYRLRNALRGGDTVARLGGDEFVLLLLGLASPAEADEAVGRLLALIAEPIVSLPRPTVVSGSMGVTLFPNDDSDPDALLRHADQAMYQAKQAGKNCFLLFDSERDRFARSRHDRVVRIRQALEQREFLLYFQPKVNMRQGRVIGVEALIRWKHPERGLLEPAEFLPVIEDDDLIKEIGDWVIETALDQMQAWQAQAVTLPVSVNVAGRQLQADDFVDKLKAALARHPSVAGQLELEILETAALADVSKTARVMDECRQLGVHFSLDDFGTGYSSLTYLKRLPSGTIKIDQSFVRDILSDFNNLVIVQGVIGLANAFQRQVIAEGVETAEHGRLLMQVNCDLAQGYGVARPMAAREIPDWVAHWRPHPGWEAIRELYWGRSDYPLLVAELQMRSWVAQLIQRATKGLPLSFMRPGDSRCCAFGNWYYGAGARRYGEKAAYVRLGAGHDKLHAIADRMGSLVERGSPEGARGLIEELLHVRDAALHTMQELQLAVAVDRAHGAARLDVPAPLAVQ